jgi:hypothetical protein
MFQVLSSVFSYAFFISINICYMLRSRDSSVGIALGYVLNDRGSIPGGGWEFFSSPPRPERLWGPPSLLSNGYKGLFR